MKQMEQKKKIEEQKILEAQKKNQDRNLILAEQLKDLDKKRSQDQSLLVNERHMLKDQWSEELARQKEQQLEELRLNKQLNNEIHHHNIEQKRVKKIDDDKIKESDKQMVDQVVLKEQMLDKLEAERK